MEWQPIDTAPKDGSEIILYPHHMSGVWDSFADSWRVWQIPLNADLLIDASGHKLGNPVFEVMANSLGMPDPTHWMPLPPPPESK